MLAVEPRVVVPRSSDSGQIIRCKVELQYADQPQYSSWRQEVTGPVLLPSLSLLTSVSVSDISYWRTEFRKADLKGWESFTSLLETGGQLNVKRKPGALLSPSLQWSLGPEQVKQLAASTEHSETLLSLYLADCPSHWVATSQCLLSVCLASSTPGLVSVWTSLLSPGASLHSTQSSALAADILNIINIARHYKGQSSHEIIATVHL